MKILRNDFLDTVAHKAGERYDSQSSPQKSVSFRDLIKESVEELRQKFMEKKKSS